MDLPGTTTDEVVFLHPDESADARWQGVGFNVGDDKGMDTVRRMGDGLPAGPVSGGGRGCGGAPGAHGLSGAEAEGCPSAAVRWNRSARRTRTGSSGGGQFWSKAGFAAFLGLYVGYTNGELDCLYRRAA